MSVRSSTEYMKMDAILSSFPLTRETRFDLRPITLDTAFAGMTELR